MATAFFLSVVCAAPLLAYPFAAAAQEAVCAEVRIEIRQKVSLERQAFDAVLRIRNGLATGSVENVSVDVLFSDVEGTPVLASSDPNNTAATFFIRLDELDGIGAVDGTGEVAPETAASIRWMIIPSASAGGSTPAGVMYMVGARLQYRLNGEETTVDVVPETITVRPQPRLALDYFLAGDVYSDDAFTPEIEPPVPFTLGLRVRNTGAGAGQKVSVESAQPQIVDNEQGLLVGFSIVGSHVDDRPAAPSLQIDFGDIPAGGVRMGRWLMETTLSGRFISIDARYTHADVLGGALTSLIDGEPGTHLLVHDVLVDLPGRDGVRDFLARDGDILRVYESNGIDSEVTDRSDVATLAPVSGEAEYALNFPVTSGFSYVRVSDPTHGTTTGVSVRRPDGRVLPSDNAWFSKSRKPDMSWAYYLDVFDVDGGGSYTVLIDAPPATGILSGSVYVDGNGNGFRDADEVGLDGVGLLLTGESAIGSVQRSALSQDGGLYRFADLPQGTYAIAVADVASHGNGVHQAGSAGGVVQAAGISQIALGAGASGEGYVFAKIPAGSQSIADLQVLALEAQTPVPLGEATSITLRVQNVGPHAAVARTTVLLPEGFMATQAVPSSGAFDANTGFWEHGALVPGQQHNLVLHGTYSQQGTWALGAAIHALENGIDDPDTSNDSQALNILVEPSPTLSVTLEGEPVGDLLFWVSCPVGAEAGCADDRAQRWEALLTQAQIRHRVETDPAVFIGALRSGEWPSIWIDGGAVLAEGTTAAEIRESVRRGGALIVSGARIAEWGRFEALAGAVHIADLPDSERSVDLLQSEYFDAGALAATGAAAVYSEGSGRVLAEYKPGMAAIVASQGGTPAPVIVFGFDPLPGMEALSEPAGFIATLAAGAAVSLPDVVLDGSRLPLRVSARRPNAIEGGLALVAGFPDTFEVLTARPSPDEITATSLSWIVSWPLPDTRFEASYVLRAPQGNGTYTLNAVAQWQVEEDEDDIEIHLRSRQGQTAFATAALDQLQTSSPDDEALRQQAIAQLAAAQAAYDQGNQAAAITALLAAIDALDGMTVAAAADVSLEVSRMLLAMSRETPVVTVELFSDGFESTP